jgi:hypothetical protein
MSLIKARRYPSRVIQVVYVMITIFVEF